MFQFQEKIEVKDDEVCCRPPCALGAIVMLILANVKSRSLLVEHLGSILQLVYTTPRGSMGER